MLREMVNALDECVANVSVASIISGELDSLPFTGHFAYVRCGLLRWMSWNGWMSRLVDWVETSGHHRWGRVGHLIHWHIHPSIAYT